MRQFKIYFPESWGPSNLIVEGTHLSAISETLIYNDKNLVAVVPKGWLVIEIIETKQN